MWRLSSVSVKKRPVSTWVLVKEAPAELKETRSATPSTRSLRRSPCTLRWEDGPIPSPSVTRLFRKSYSSSESCGFLRWYSRNFLGSQLPMNAKRTTRNPSVPMEEALVATHDVHPVDHRHDGNQRGGGENNSQQRQEAAQLAAAQRIQRNAGGLEEGCFGFHGDLIS